MKGKVSRTFPALTKRQKAWTLGGFYAAALGLLLLGFSDEEGGNWAARLSPFVTLGGYAAALFGLLSDAPEPPKDPVPGP